MNAPNEARIPWAKMTYEQRRAHMNAYSRRNRLAINARKRTQRNSKEGKIAYAAYHKKWSDSKRGRVQSYAALSDAKSRGLMRLDANIDAMCVIYEMASRITKCTGIRFAVDHVIPLSSGGWHHEHNLHVLSLHLNSTKGCNPVWDVEGYKSFADVPRHLWPEKLVPAYDALIQHKLAKAAA